MRGLNLNWDFDARRRFSALACLLGLAFFYTQVAAISFVVGSGVCCGGDHCPIAGHHHSAAKPANAPGDCGHTMQHGIGRGQMDHQMGDMGHTGHSGHTGQMFGCSPSCCQTSSPIAFHSDFYRLTPSIVASGNVPVWPSVSAPVSRVTFLAVAPPVPPPKPLTAIA